MAAIRENLEASHAEIVAAIAAKPKFKGNEKEALAFFNWAMKPAQRAAYRLPDFGGSDALP